jgi:N-acetylmuramoyl-L-alanine amidase
VPGVSAHGTTYYPIWALDRLGASTVADARGAQTSLFGDTLIFDALSPWFRTRRAVEHLAFPVIRHGGVVHLPEQFFIEWLPAHHEARVDYRGGVLRARRAAGAIAAAVTRTPEDTRVVIIDPGHGGRDPGRIGPDGLREKDVALAISQRLARALRERGYEVHLTRATDTLVALGDRPRLANEWRDGRPAVFVSLHANAADEDAVRGFETFFLSEARTEDEQRVAEMENAAIEFEDGDGAVSDLDVILNGLRNDFWVRASSDLAEIVQSGLASAHDGPDRGVKRAGFRVLVGALMPAVLVEVAFLSNRADAQMLASEAFRDRTARGIADAIHGFFESHHYLSAGTR